MGRKARPQVLPPIVSGKNTAKLDSQKAVRLEMAKLYRLVLNGKLPSDVAARLVYILKEVRSTLEAEPPPALLVGGLVGIGPIWALPRGCQMSEDRNSVIWPDGTVTAPKPPEFFTPTPELEQLPMEQAETFERLPVYESDDDDKVVVLRPHSSDEPGPGAA